MSQREEPSREEQEEWSRCGWRKEPRVGVALIEGEGFRDGVAGGFYVLSDLGWDVELVGEQGDLFPGLFSKRDFEGLA